MGGAHAEDGGEDGDVGGEGEVVVGYSQGHGQALDRLIAKQAFASTAKEKKRSEAGRDKTEQNGQREKEKGRSGENFICRAWHAEKGIITFSYSALFRIMQNVLSVVASKQGCGCTHSHRHVRQNYTENAHMHVFTWKQQNMLQPDSY